eukprot:TRINITY_DN50033_c0_g1_i1.p1 TRINITY_DN50033_c0_g1~~TRINITY_DN50033_c0_g1_i1.p1  ORF type:complete len:446 (-),score=93.49 TRINITY_DN50033_c0_g1_i1:12-1349(-)
MGKHMTLPGSCLFGWRCTGSKQQKAGPEDAVRKLKDTVDQFSFSEDNGSLEQKERMTQLCEELHGHLLSVLASLELLVGSKSNQPDSHPSGVLPKEMICEHIDSLAQFLEADLPVQLLSQLGAMQFETRKLIMNVFCALLWPDLPAVVGTKSLQYLRCHATLFTKLMSGYLQEDTAFHCGVVLRSLLRHSDLVDAFLLSGQIFELMECTCNPSIEIAADAMFTLNKALLDFKDVSGPWLNAHFEKFFSLCNKLLQSENYIVQRQVIMLLVGILLDIKFQRAMKNYVCKIQNLKIVMNLLLAESSIIKSEAFHIFKVFVVNPRKPAGVQQILVKNKTKLVALIESLESARSDDTCFARDRQKVVERLMDMTVAPGPPRIEQGPQKAESLPRTNSSVSMATTYAESNIASECYAESGVESVGHPSPGCSKAIVESGACVLPETKMAL